MTQENDIRNFVCNSLLQGVDVLFFVYNFQEKKFEFLNDAFMKIWGVEKSLYLKNPELLLDTLVDDDRGYLLQKFQNLFEGKNEEQFELKIWTTSRQKKWISIRVYAFKTTEGKLEYVYGHGEEITLRKEYELNLLNINERKNNVLQIIGHDLRGPLENLKSFTNLLEKEYETKQFKDFQTYIKFMRQTCQNSINLITELLTMEFMLSDQVELRITRIDLIERINVIFETYRLADKNIKKNFVIESNLEKVFIEVDELKFILILSNLVSNAYKFTRDDGTITIKVEDKVDKVLIQVKDDGIGIPEKLQPYLFEKFSKARRPGIHGEKPIGLGLHIIKYMVELHKGKIWFESTEHVGTEFFVEIPRLSQ